MLLKRYDENPLFCLGVPPPRSEFLGVEFSRHRGSESFRSEFLRHAEGLSFTSVSSYDNKLIE